MNKIIAAEYDAAEFVCIPSKFVASTFLDAGFPEEKICLNPYGVDVQFWKRTSEEERTADRPFHAIFTGTMLLRKGLWYLLEAWKKLAPNDAKLTLVGSIYPDCQQLMKNLPPGVDWVGRLDQAALRELYRQADLFVLPSLEEGMARAVLEAMAAGLPALVTYETGTTDIVLEGESGWVIPSADVDALASRLQHAIESRDKLRGMGASALERVAPFTWKAYGERAAAFLRNVNS
ncbi:MAG: glycosyltransferase family 4 protein [Planctomycetaceae bacterium]|nr:glycosyltransferase family 4 protein [Planctomycetaceae bacterium]